jgi:hypothetical protein
MNMSNFQLHFFVFLTTFSMVESTLASWTPQVYNAIKWTAPNQDQETIAFTTNQGITRVPIIYHGGVDRDESGTITDQNIDRFSQWVREHLAIDYCGPIVMDYEHPWWKELSAKSITPKRLDEILSIYTKGIRVAGDVLPSAQWGYWGLPLLRQTTQKWLDQGLSLEPLISHCSALYPDIYDSNMKGDSAPLIEKHISKVLELAGGRIPVYVFVSPRFTGQGGDHSFFVPNDVFLKQTNAAMKAVWVDEDGVQHKIQGLILWDTYKFSPESDWKELDQKHKYYFELLQALVKAWEMETQGTEVNTGLSTSSLCQYALPEPTNSVSELKSRSQSTEENTRVRPEKESDRVGSGRIRGNRVKE